MDEETVKMLCKDINNRMYTYLSAYYGDDEVEFDKMEKTINHIAKSFRYDWDKAEKVSIFMDL